MGTEEIPPGEAIPQHRHLDADEIILIQRGTGRAQVGSHAAAVGPGDCHRSIGRVYPLRPRAAL